MPTKPAVKSVVSEVADRYCSRYPDLPSRTLAKLIADKEPLLFTIESARNAIRYRRGTKGLFCRNKLETPVQTPGNPFNLPDGEENDYNAYRIEFAKQSRVLVLSDIHIPYHSVPALTAAIEEGKRQEIDVIFLNGDTIDCYQLSRWEKDPRKRHFKDEVDATREFLTRLRDIFPKARIIWKDGNHDERLQKYLVANAPAIFSLNIATYPALLDFCSLRIDYVTDKRPIRLGKLNVLHGHEFPNAMLGPVNPARGLFLRAKDSCMAGHWHQTSEHSEPTIQEKLIATWSTGCLCDLHPEYMPLNRWNHGFSTVEVAPNGDFEVRNRRVHRGRLR